ncbi:cell division protein DivIB [Sporosarcina sp. NCCP-2716]|nr:cell division protein DivIB [Sporosarcina sp. NCCP-2716]
MSEKEGEELEKVIDIEDRIPSMRKKRRKKTNRKFIFVLLVFVAALLVLLYFQSQMSKIDSVELNNTALHDRDYYLKQAGLREGDSLWGFSAAEAAGRLTDTEGVEKASVRRKWLRTVTVDIEEWKPVAWAETKGTYEFILEDGGLFVPAAGAAADIPIAIGFSDETMRKQLASQLLGLNDTVYELISEVRLAGKDKSDSVVLYMDDGYEVHASLATLADKLSYYPDIVNELTGSEKGVIDVEVGTYFTPYSKVYGDRKAGEEDDGTDGAADGTADSES